MNRYTSQKRYRNKIFYITKLVEANKGTIIVSMKDCVFEDTITILDYSKYKYNDKLYYCSYSVVMTSIKSQYNAYLKS